MNEDLILQLKELSKEQQIEIVAILNSNIRWKSSVWISNNQNV